MKTPLPLSSIVEFPTPVGCSAAVLDQLPSLGAFPAYFDGTGYVVAVPAVICLELSAESPVNEAIAEAVAHVRSAEMRLSPDFEAAERGEGWALPTDGWCIPLGNSAKLQALPNPQTRARFLAALKRSLCGITESMRSSGLDDPFEVERAENEIGAWLDVLALSGGSSEGVKAS